MNISRIFIVRPVATTVLVAAIVIFGLGAFRALPINELPNVDFAGGESGCHGFHGGDATGAPVQPGFGHRFHELGEQRRSYAHHPAVQS